MVSHAVPRSFGEGDISLDKHDFPAQAAPMNSAMQGVAMSETAVDNTQNKYDVTIAK
jgi:hypothetical protein